MSSSQGSPARWTKLRDRSLALTRIFDLRAAAFRHPVRGTEKEFVVIDAPDWVVVLAVTTDARLVLVNQFRFGVDAPSLELPGGVIERGEDPVAAGLREVEEETGFRPKRARLLGTVHPNPAIQNNTCHLVLAEEAELAASLAWDEDEEIELVTAPVADAFAWARSGRITHALSLNALFLFEPVWREQSRA
jgi:8-oxo-dGTP pyrophosphatase MutT (NUDIX family)